MVRSSCIFSRSGRNCYISRFAHFSHSRIFLIKRKKRNFVFSGMMSGSSRKGGKRFQVLSDDRDAETMIETASTTGSVASLGFVSQTLNFYSFIFRSIRSLSKRLERQHPFRAGIATYRKYYSRFRFTHSLEITSEQRVAFSDLYI